MRKNKKNSIRLKKVNAKTLRRASKLLMSLAVVLGAYFIILYVPFSASADKTTTFQVNVVETLSVSVTTPDSSHWASGTPTTTSDTGFLRNDIILEVSSNNTVGFTAMMYANTSATGNTSLVNTTKNSETLPTLNSSSSRGSFPANYWGYSLDVSGTGVYNGATTAYNETDAGNESSNYYPLTTSANPVTVLTGTGATTGTRKIYFGAKADITQASGTYAGTVIISVVTGEINDNNDSENPVSPPDNPAIDNDQSGVNPSYETSYGTGSQGWTVYTSTSSGTGTETTTTQVSDGDVRSAYPLGATEKTVSNIETKSALATGLAITATTVAASGAFFFIAAKRREDDDEEEQ